MEWYKASDTPTNSKPFIQRVKVNGKNLCLVGYNNEVFAVGSTCPHAGAELSGGWCSDGKIICPFHRYAYDLKTGKGDPGQNDFIDTYPVEVRADGIYIGMFSFAERLKALLR